MKHREAEPGPSGFLSVSILLNLRKVEMLVSDASDFPTVLGWSTLDDDSATEVLAELWTWHRGDFRRENFEGLQFSNGKIFTTQDVQSIFWVALLWSTQEKLALTTCGLLTQHHAAISKLGELDEVVALL